MKMDRRADERWRMFVDLIRVLKCQQLFWLTSDKWKFQQTECKTEDENWFKCRAVISNPHHSNNISENESAVTFFSWSEEQHPNFFKSSKKLNIGRWTCFSRARCWSRIKKRNLLVALIRIHSEESKNHRSEQMAREWVDFVLNISAKPSWSDTTSLINAQRKGFFGDVGSMKQLHLLLSEDESL